MRYKTPHPIRPGFTHHMRQKGFTLIESLVALVIFAFGMLAIAGLQLSSLVSNQYAAQAVIGTNYARDYSEMMLLVPADVSNISGATDTNDMFVQTGGTGAGSYSSSDAALCAGNSKTCTPADFAKSLRNDWAMRVTKDLPEGRAEVCKDSVARKAADLKWGGCDNTGAMTLIKLGWASKTPARTDANQDWISADKPRIAVTVLGNSRDFRVSP